MKLIVAAALIGVAVPAVAQEAPPTGEEVFKKRCSLCHRVKLAPAKAPAALGPNLAGVVGRMSGSGTFNYSPALTAAKIQWTKANLDKYLIAPSKMVAGTRMIIALPDAKQRRAVIEYLATVK